MFTLNHFTIKTRFRIFKVHELLVRFKIKELTLINGLKLTGPP